jgi:PST family polysaccharide transporter
LIVGRFAGAEAVGFVALAIRIATLLSFAKAVTWRVALAALAKLGGDRERLCRGITEGMRLQAVAVGLPLAGFATVAPFVFPLFFGQRWMPALGIFPFIALSYLANSVFNLHASVLYLLQKNWEVTWFNCAHVALFASGAALLVPRLGLMGYGWAEIVALPSYLLLHVLVTREVGSPSYTTALIWFATIVIVFVVCSLGASVAYLGPLILLVPTMFFEERASLIGYAQLLLSRRSV